MKRIDGTKMNHRRCPAVALFIAAFLMMPLASCENSLVEAAKAIQAEAIAPSITMSDPQTNLVEANSIVTFPQTELGSSSDITLTIINSGKTALAIDQEGIVITRGAGTELETFTVKALPLSSVEVDQSTTFTLCFTPSSNGSKSATVSIPTNIPNSPLFTFTVQYIDVNITMTTTIITIPTFTTATSGGTISDDGGNPILSRGICWGTSPNPTTTDTKSIDPGKSTGTYSCDLTNLLPGTFYYVRAYATNSLGTKYGLAVSFTTNAATPPTTITITDIYKTTAVSGVTIVANEGVNIGSSGICLSTTSNPTIADKQISAGTTAGSYPLNLIELIKDTTYYVRAYATNQGGTLYGAILSFQTVGFSGPAGGWVFYDAGTTQTDANGSWRYLEAAPVAGVTTYTTWWNDSFSTTGATAIALGSGLPNTNTIWTSLGTAKTYAARICYDLIFGDKSDWYLPSKDELFLMLRDLKFADGFGSYPIGYYWTSSETNATNVYLANIYSSIIGGLKSDSQVNTWPVRRYLNP